jgi:hypothetical protein
MSDRYIFTIGFIPKGRNIERIICGDPESCGTVEVNLVIENNTISCLELPNMQIPDCSDEELAKKNSAINAAIAEKFLQVFKADKEKIVSVLEAAFTHFLGDGSSGKIRKVADQDDCGEFANKAAKYDNLYYVRYQYESDDEVVNEEVIVINQ